MSLGRLLALVLILPWVGGCYGVFSTQVVGEKPLAAVPEKWEGTWVHEDGAITVVVSDKERGQLEVGWVEQKQGKLVFENHHVELRQSGDWVFGNVRSDEKPKLYAWGRVRLDGDELLVWTPDRARFEELVRKRVVEGRVEKKGEDVVLTSFTPEVVQRLVSSDGGMPLDWERPLVFRRLSR